MSGATGGDSEVGTRNPAPTSTLLPAGGPDGADAGTNLPPGPAEVRILLIEDDEGDALLVEELLARSGTNFACSRRATLANGLKELGRGYDCVVVDLGLPDSQDLEAVEAILERDPSAAVVVLTGFGDRSVGAQAVALGAQDYLVKGSVDHELLSRSIGYAIARRDSRVSSRQLSEAQLLRAENARLERGLIAQPIIRNPRLHWSARYEAGGRRALLGGDFFDGIELDDGAIRLVVGDVCGHGPDEAALGVALRVAWRALVLAHEPPDAVINAVQRVLESERASEEVFATLCDIEFHPDLTHAQMRLAGHPNPLLLSGADVTEVSANARGPLLGVFEETKWPASYIELGAEWTLVVFTDGIIEGRDASTGDRFETTGLARAVTANASTDIALDDLGRALISNAEKANGEPLCDDVALVMLSNSTRWAR